MSEVESTRVPMRAVIISVVAVALAACLFAAGIGIGLALGVTRAASPTSNDNPVEANSTPASSGDSVAADCPPSAAAPEDADFAPFWEAWNAVEDRYYYDLPTAEERMHGAIRGMMESLGDQHSSFMD